jgi:parallel beta-helix repeat protein
LGGIIGARAWAQVTIRDNVIEGTGGSGSDGDGIYIADCQRFHIADNQVTGALRTGASGIEIGGSSNNGIVTNNIVAGCWQGIHVTDSVGTVGQVLLTANFSFDNVDNKDYDNSSSGEKVHAYLNAFGPELEIGL